MRRVIPGLEAPDAALEAEIRARLDRVEEALEKAVVADSELLAATARYLLSAGGKRFRPMLVLLAGYFGDPTDPRLIPGSVTIELTHLATLYHDDVIDEAEDRRGVRQHERALGQHGGDPDRRLPVRPGLGAVRRPRARRSAGSSPARSRCCATARSARWTPRAGSSRPRPRTWRSSDARRAS